MTAAIRPHNVKCLDTTPFDVHWLTAAICIVSERKDSLLSTLQSAHEHFLADGERSYKNSQFWEQSYFGLEPRQATKA